MRWLFPFISAVVGGLISGWPGGVIGFAIGCVIAAIVTRKRESHQVPPVLQQTAPLSQPPSQQINPAPTVSPTVDRLHEIMRQIDSSQSGAAEDDPRHASSGIGISISFGNDEAPARRGRGPASKLTWYGPGEPLIHADLVIDSGMIFTADRSLPWPGEPSAIITTLSVARLPAHPLADFGYYPSYDRISADQRRCYLEWLAAGRKDVDPAQRSLGYVFIFFYGLERQIILDADRDPALLEEMIRLLEHYGAAHKSRSLRSYFLQLLHFAGWQLGPDAYRSQWPRLLEFDTDRPDGQGLRFVLANLHQRREPLDWTVAYRIALASLESRRSTVVTRAQEKFFALFEQRFRDQFGDGLLLESAKQDALVQYRPASGALTQMSYERRRNNPFELRIPNAAGLHRQFKPLPAIWNSCVDDLSGYSRALRSKKQGQSAALAAWQSLPQELRRVEDHPLKPAFDELIDQASREGDFIFLPTSVMATLSGIPERAKLTTAHSRELADTAEGLGWAIAPDARITGLPLSWNQELALYRAGTTANAAEDLSGVVRLLYLAVTVAAADGVIEPQEMDGFFHLVSEHISDESNWLPVRATEASLRRDPNVALRSLPTMSKLIPADSRQAVLRVMAHIAAADTEVSLDELKVLRRIARAFDLEPDSVDKLLREDEAFREATIAAGERSKRGEPIPTRPSEKPTFALNEERIRALTQETSEVISLLSVVMAEPEEIPCAPTAPPPSPARKQAVEWLSGLEERYHPAVLSLIRHDEITSTDFDCIAAEHHLLPDDLFDAVNTWADETLGDFLLERGENVRVFRDLLPELAALPIAA